MKLIRAWYAVQLTRLTRWLTRRAVLAAVHVRHEWQDEFGQWCMEVGIADPSITRQEAQARCDRYQTAKRLHADACEHLTMVRAGR